MKFLKVPKKFGETVRRELIQNRLFDTNYPVLKQDDFLLFPVMQGWKNFDIVELEAERRSKSSSNLKDELEKMVSSFDIVGGVAIIEIPKALEAKERLIGKSILKTHKNVRSVFKKLGGMQGQYRVRLLKLIAGQNRTETLYKENGVQIKLDLAKVYFSVRLTHERKRISELTLDGENVIVMFAGVGPFALVMAKKNKKGKIIAIELNPDACKYLRENIQLNKAENRIIPEEGDVRAIASKKYQNFADRVVMPLPHSAHEFLDVAFAAIKDRGIVHFYAIVNGENAFETAFQLAKKEAKKANVSIQIAGKRIVRPYSPKEVQVVLDLLVQK